jgi:hypothetical protein
MNLSSIFGVEVQLISSTMKMEAGGHREGHTSDCQESVTAVSNRTIFIPNRVSKRMRWAGMQHEWGRRGMRIGYWW